MLSRQAWFYAVRHYQQQRHKRPPEINGFSEAEFIEAAGEFGIPSDVAAAAWDDPATRASIPVKSTISGTPTTNAGSNRAVTGTEMQAAASYTKTCTMRSKNVLGNDLMVLTVRKSWAGANNVITSPSTVVTHASGAWGWNYEGLVIETDYFNGPSTYPKSRHLSIRTGKFTTAIPAPYSANQQIKVDVFATGPASCQNSGGV